VKLVILAPYYPEALAVVVHGILPESPTPKA